MKAIASLRDFKFDDLNSSDLTPNQSAELLKSFDLIKLWLTDLEDDCKFGLGELHSFAHSVYCRVSFMRFSIFEGEHRRRCKINAPAAA